MLGLMLVCFAKPLCFQSDDQSQPSNTCRQIRQCLAGGSLGRSLTVSFKAFAPFALPCHFCLGRRKRSRNFLLAGSSSVEVLPCQLVPTFEMEDLVCFWRCRQHCQSGSMQRCGPSMEQDFTWLPVPVEHRNRVDPGRRTVQKRARRRGHRR